MANNQQQWFIAPDGSKWPTKEARDSYVRGGMRGSNLLKPQQKVSTTGTVVPEQPSYFSAEAKAERLRQTTTPTSGTTVTARPFEGMTAAQREQELLKTAGASEESQRIAGLTQQEQFAEELKTAQEGVKQEKEITAMERKIRDQQLRDMVARTERSVAGVTSAYGQSPEGATASTKGQIVGGFATTQNKAIQTAVENVRIQDMRIESLEKERQRKLDQGAVAAVKDIDAQLENARLTKIQAEQLAQQTEMTAKQNATAYIDTLSQSGALAAMSEQDINALIPTIQGLPENVVRSMIQGQLAISEGAEATQKFDLMQKGMQTFLGFAKEGVEMPEGSILSFSQQYGIPAEVLLEFNQKASQIKDKESLEYTGLVDNLNKQLKGWDDKSKRTVDTLAEMYRQGVSPEIISAYKEANNLTDYDDPKTKLELESQRLDNEIKRYEADNLGKPPPKGTKERLDYDIKVLEKELKQQELNELLGVGEYGDVTDTTSFVEGRQPRIIAGGAANGAGKTRDNPATILTDINFGEGKIGNTIDINGEQMVITGQFGESHSHISNEGQHNGIDFRTKDRTDPNNPDLGGFVPAFTDGEIVKKGNSPGTYGGYVWVRDNNGKIWQYGHLNVDDVNNINVGDSLSKGQNFIHAEHRKDKWGASNAQHLDLRMVGEQEGITPISKDINDRIDLLGLKTEDKKDLQKQLRGKSEEQVDKMVKGKEIEKFEPLIKDDIKDFKKRTGGYEDITSVWERILPQIEKFESGDVSDEFLNSFDQIIGVQFQKILDPTSVVRESEFERLASFQSLDASIGGKLGALAEGGAGLTDEGRKGVINAMKDLVSGSKDTRNRILDETLVATKALQVPDDFVKSRLGIKEEKQETPKITQENAPTLSSFGISNQNDDIIDGN